MVWTFFLLINNDKLLYKRLDSYSDAFFGVSIKKELWQILTFVIKLKKIDPRLEPTPPHPPCDLHIPRGLSGFFNVHLFRVCRAQAIALHCIIRKQRPPFCRIVVWSWVSWTSKKNWDIGSEWLNTTLKMTGELWESYIADQSCVFNVLLCCTFHKISISICFLTFARVSL